MRVAITGSSGLIGTALRRQLEVDGHEVVPVVRGAPDKPQSMWQPNSGWIRPGPFDGVHAIVTSPASPSALPNPPALVRVVPLQTTT